MRDRLPADAAEQLDNALRMLDAIPPHHASEMYDDDGVLMWLLDRGDSRGKAIARFASEWGVHFTEVRVRARWMTWQPREGLLDLLDERLDDALADVLYPTPIQPGQPYSEPTDEQIAAAWSGEPAKIVQGIVAGRGVFPYWDETGRGCPWVACRRGTPGAFRWWEASNA